MDFTRHVIGGGVPTCNGWSANYASIILKCPAK